MASDAWELEPARGEFKPTSDKRPHMPEPPPVRMVTVEDVHLAAAAGMETELDEFYVGMLKFDREPGSGGTPVYRAENYRVRFDVHEPPIDRQDFRPLVLEVPSLASLEKDLLDREIEYEWHRGLTPGSHVLVFRDPAGNWVQVGEFRRVG